VRGINSPGGGLTLPATADLALAQSADSAPFHLLISCICSTRPRSSSTIVALVPIADPPADGWQRLSAGDGAKGPLVDGRRRWVLLRRSVADPDDLTAYVSFAPDGATLADLARVAGSRWTVEICFDAAKQEVGLAEYEVRGWRGWYQHIALTLLALAFLLSVQQAGNKLARRLTVPQVGRLLRVLLPRRTWTLPDLLHRLADTQRRNAWAQQAHAKSHRQPVPP